MPETERERLRRLLRVNEACEAIGVSRSVMYRLIAAGEVETVHIGRSRMVLTSSLDAFVERLRAPQPA